MRALTVRLATSVVVVMLLATACGSDEPRELAGVRRTPLPVVNTTTLPDVAHGGVDFEFEAADGELLIVYFGYTQCPDVCPTTLSDIRSALRKMDTAEADQVSLAFATVDPDRDEADIISGYVQSFVDDAAALRTTDPDALRAAADAFGAVYEVTETDAGDVEVIHSGFAYVVDDQGQLLVTWPFGIPADDMAADLGLLFDEVEAA